MKLRDFIFLSFFYIAIYIDIYINYHNQAYSDVKIDLYILLGFSFLRIFIEGLDLINSHTKRKLDERINQP